MASDKQVSITIEGADTSGKKTSTKIPYINPNISDTTMKDFAEKCAALSSDTYIGTIKTTEEDITNGGSGLETVGYTLRYGDTTDFVPGVIYPADENGKSIAHTLYLVSSTGTDTQSGATGATFSGKKPKGCTITFNDGMIRFQFSGLNYKEEDEAYHQFAIHVTTTGKATETLYLYFVANEDDMEAI